MTDEADDAAKTTEDKTEATDEPSQGHVETMPAGKVDAAPAAEPAAAVGALRPPGPMQRARKAYVAAFGVPAETAPWPKTSRGLGNDCYAEMPVPGRKPIQGYGNSVAEAVEDLIKRLEALR